jgi:mannose-6-phosphate isomerase
MHADSNQPSADIPCARTKEPEYTSMQESHTMTWSRLKEKLRAHGVPGWCDELPKRPCLETHGNVAGACRNELISVGLRDAHHALQTWLTTYAYDLWWTKGADHTRGGFHERLHLDATPTDEPRRARLHPRQAFAYSHAAELGWTGPADRALEHGLSFFVSHYKRGDGFYRTKVAPDGKPLDDNIELYDQAFALLGFASAYASCSEQRWRTEAHVLHASLARHLRRAGGGFEESIPARIPLTSNSHMHLLEAAHAWVSLDPDTRWLTLATQLIELVETRMMSPPSGVVSERFDGAWEPLRAEGWSLEPGHQFEWASLLLHFSCHRPEVTQAALRLIEFGESYGIDPQRRVVMNSCFVNGRRHDDEARLWPQTERIKASCMAAEATGDFIHVSHAIEATHTLMRYFETPVRGLWRDRMTAEGVFFEEPVPASSFYHIVGAALALDRLTRVSGLQKTLNEI